MEEVRQQIGGVILEAICTGVLLFIGVYFINVLWVIYESVNKFYFNSKSKFKEVKEDRSLATQIQ